VQATRKLQLSTQTYLSDLTSAKTHIQRRLARVRARFRTQTHSLVTRSIVPSASVCLLLRHFSAAMAFLVIIDSFRPPHILPWSAQSCCRGLSAPFAGIAGPGLLSNNRTQRTRGTVFVFCRHVVCVWGGVKVASKWVAAGAHMLGNTAKHARRCAIISCPLNTHNTKKWSRHTTEMGPATSLKYWCLVPGANGHRQRFLRGPILHAPMLNINTHARPRSRWQTCLCVVLYVKLSAAVISLEAESSVGLKLLISRS
jgi:hypothetical protein